MPKSTIRRFSFPRSGGLVEIGPHSFRVRFEGGKIRVAVIADGEEKVVWTQAAERLDSPQPFVAHSG